MGSFSGLLNNSILLLALCAVYDSFGIYAIPDKKLREGVTGILISIITVAVMVNPWVLKPGIFFDTRGVILGLSGLFFGIVPTSIAVVIAALLRIYQGGSGVLPGTLVVISTAAIGLIWRYRIKRNIRALNWRQLYVFGLVVHIGFVLCLVTLPSAIRFNIILTVAPPILMIFPLISLLGGIILLKQELRRETERKLVENRRILAKERGLLRGVMDTIPDLIYFKDTQGKYLGCNKAFQNYLGKEEKEIQGQFPDAFLEEETASYSAAKDIETLANGTITSYEVCFKTPNGRSSVFETIKTPFKGTDGTLYGLVGISRDITRRKQAETERRQLENQLSNALDMANLGHWEYDVVNDLFLFNDYFYKIFRTSVEQVGGYTLSSEEYAKRFVHPDDRNLVAGEVRKAVEGTDPNLKYKTEHRMIYADGEVGYMSVEFFIVLDPDGKTMKTYGVNQDITERKRMENRLRQAQRIESIGNLAGGIAHDFNNLLSPIIGMSEMLLEDLPKDSLEHENAAEIFRAGKRAADLVQQILAFSRQSEHKMTPVRVQNVLKEVLKLSRSTIPSNVDIRRRIRENCGLVMADAAQIHQVAMNLITNAYHAVEDENGVIDIALEQVTVKENEPSNKDLLPGDYARLSVTDNGTGMAPDTMGKIFEPYFTTKEKGKGTGLGLAVVYGIVKEHKGDISVYSEVGKGTTVCVDLPLMKTATKAVATERTLKLARGTESILLVDDEAPVAKLEGQMLSRLGYKVTVITDSGKALNAFRSDPDSFDLVISDMTMPDMTGDRLTERILSIKPDMPVIICTGFSERINKDQAETIGVKGFLMKPVLTQDMACMVRKVLDEPMGAKTSHGIDNR